jgi:hypothetical protein
MAGATERIVVQATAQEKKLIVAKAKKLGLPVSELMRRGAAAYATGESDADLAALADAAKDSADRSGAAIDAALDFISASEKRISAMEAKAAKSSVRKAA